MPTATATAQAPIVKPGTYVATLRAVEDFKSAAGNELWRWVFEIERKGKVTEIRGISSTVFSPKAKARAWAEVLLGRPIANGEVLDLGTLAGKQCQLVVSNETKGDTTYDRIDSVIPLPASEDEDDEPF